MQAESSSRTQVGIVGAGPAGLILSHLLEREGIDSVVLEDAQPRVCRAAGSGPGCSSRDRRPAHGAGPRRPPSQEGLVHEGIELRFDGAGTGSPSRSSRPARAITIYGQQEVVKDLIAARLDCGGPLLFEVDDVTPSRASTRPARASTTGTTAPA